MSFDSPKDSSDQDRQENKSQLTSAVKIKKKTPQPLFIKIALPLVVLLFLNAVYQNSQQLLRDQNWYRLKKVEFVGINKMNPYRLAQKLDLKKDANLLFFDERDLTDKIRQWDRFETAEVQIEYPDTLRIEIEEKQPDFLIRMGNRLATVTSSLNLVALGEEVVSYDLFVIEVDQAEEIDLVLKDQRLKSFIEIYQKLPEKEKDIINIFSGIKLASHHDQNQEHVFYIDQGDLIISLVEITLDQIRKARYAFLYVQAKQLKVSKIEIKREWVVLKMKETDQEAFKKIRTEKLFL